LQNAHFPFIYCVEKLVYKGKYLQWETCFEELGLDQEPVTDCYTSGYGKEVSVGVMFSIYSFKVLWICFTLNNCRAYCWCWCYILHLPQCLDLGNLKEKKENGNESSFHVAEDLTDLKYTTIFNYLAIEFFWVQMNC